MAGDLASQDIPLPPLREDLQIVRGVSYSGAPVWIVLDPILQPVLPHYLRDVPVALRVWNRARTVSQLNAAVAGTFGRETSPEEIGAAMRLLDASFFFSMPCQAPGAASTKRRRPGIRSSCR